MTEKNIGNHVYGPEDRIVSASISSYENMVYGDYRYVEGNSHNHIYNVRVEQAPSGLIHCTANIIERQESIGHLYSLSGVHAALRRKTIGRLCSYSTVEATNLCSLYGWHHPTQDTPGKWYIGSDISRTYALSGSDYLFIVGSVLGEVEGGSSHTVGGTVEVKDTQVIDVCVYDLLHGVPEVPIITGYNLENTPTVTVSFYGGRSATFAMDTVESGYAIRTPQEVSWGSGGWRLGTSSPLPVEVLVSSNEVVGVSFDTDAMLYLSSVTLTYTEPQYVQPAALALHATIILRQRVEFAFDTYNVSTISNNRTGTPAGDIALIQETSGSGSYSYTIVTAGEDTYADMLMTRDSAAQGFGVVAEVNKVYRKATVNGTTVNSGYIEDGQLSEQYASVNDNIVFDSSRVDTVHRVQVNSPTSVSLIAEDIPSVLYETFYGNITLPTGYIGGYGSQGFVRGTKITRAPKEEKITDTLGNVYTVVQKEETVGSDGHVEGLAYGLRSRTEDDIGRVVTDRVNGYVYSNPYTPQNMPCIGYVPVHAGDFSFRMCPTVPELGLVYGVASIYVEGVGAIHGYRGGEKELYTTLKGSGTEYFSVDRAVGRKDGIGHYPGGLASRPPLETQAEYSRAGVGYDIRTTEGNLVSSFASDTTTLSGVNTAPGVTSYDRAYAAPQSLVIPYTAILYIRYVDRTYCAVIKILPYSGIIGRLKESTFEEVEQLGSFVGEVYTLYSSYISFANTYDPFYDDEGAEIVADFGYSVQETTSKRDSLISAIATLQEASAEDYTSVRDSVMRSFKCAEQVWSNMGEVTFIDWFRAPGIYAVRPVLATG